MRTKVGKFKTPPFGKHQEVALRKIEERTGLKQYYYGLFMEQGTGKTWVVIQRMARLWAQDGIDSVIIWAPNGVQDQWVDEQLPEHMPPWVDYKAFAWSAKMGKQRQREYAQFLTAADTAKHLRILALNVESLTHARGRAAINDFLAQSGRTMGVVDESDTIKNRKTERFKTLRLLRKQLLYRYIMTGTPNPQGPFDLFSQMEFLDPYILGPNEVIFRRTYAEMIKPTDDMAFAIRAKSGAKFLPDIVAKDDEGRPKYRNLDRLNKIVSAHSYRVLKQDCLDLPDKVYVRRICEMETKQRHMYNEAVRTMRIEWEGADKQPKIAVATKLTIIGRLHQIAGGFTPDQQPIFAEPSRENPKLVALLETVSKQPNAIIWARHTAEVEMLVEALSEHGEVVAYYGEVSKGKRKKAVANFRAGEARWFVGNMAAGGIGLNLAVSSFMHYYSNSLPLRLRLQSEDRGHRIGMPDQKLTIYDYEAKGTVDRRIINLLRERLSIADLVQGDKRMGEWLNEV